MKNLKKVMAVTLAATMMIGNASVVLADEQEAAPTTSVSVEAPGTYEGDEVDYPANAITLPTLAVDNYKYLADPNGLILETEKAKYSSATFEEGKSLWFLSAENTYTSTTVATKVTSENPNPIDVSVTLEVANASDVSTGIGISDDKTFADDTKANLYFAIVDTDATDAKKADVPLKDMTSAVTMTKKIDGVSGNYELQYADSAYSYKKLETGDTGFTDWNSFEFKLEGAINTNGTWDNITTLPTLKVTWSWEDYKGDAPSVTTAEYTIDAVEDIEVAVNLGTLENAATGISEITYLNMSGASRTLATTEYSFENNVLTIKSSQASTILSTAEITHRTYTIKFNNGKTASFTFVKETE